MYMIDYKKLKRSSVFFMLKPNSGMYLFLTICFLLFLLFIFWALIFPMDDIVKGKVLLRPENSISSVKSLVSGQVKEKYYENNKYVNKGDVIYTLDTNSLEVQKQSYIVQKEIVTENILINNALYKTIETGNNSEKVVYSHSYSNSQKYIYQRDYYEAEIERLNVEIHREEIKPELIKIRNDMENLLMEKKQKEIEYKTWKEQTKVTVLEERKMLRIQLENLESNLAILERSLKNSIVLAPISGRIKETRKVNIGDFIIEGDEILRIVPQNSDRLKAEIIISSKDVPKVKIGDPCKIRFERLPPSQYGQIETFVSLIPSDCNIDGDSVYFIVEAIIDKPYLTLKANKEKKIKLSPGISAEARISTDKNTVMNMILRKLEFIYE